jgi:hypothetical protein
MTIQQLFKQYPLIASKIAKRINMPKQQLNRYIHGGKITNNNLSRIQEAVNKIGWDIYQTKLEK